MSWFGMGSKKFVRWSEFKNKDKVWDMLEMIGDRIVVVVADNRLSSGVSKSASAYGANKMRKLKVNYSAAHLVEVELVEVM